MDRFVARLNIEHLRDALATETNQAKRKMLERLLAEQEEELKAANKRHEQQDTKNQQKTGC
jgi:hypothetical protein